MTNRSVVADMTRTNFEAVFETLATEIVADFDSYDLPSEARAHLEKVCFVSRVLIFV